MRHDRYRADTGVLAAIHLIHYGSTRYVGSPLIPAGEWTGWYVLDTSFVVIEKLAW